MYTAVIPPEQRLCMQLIVVGSPEYGQIHDFLGSLLVANNPLPALGIVESLIFTLYLMELCDQHTGEPKHNSVLAPGPVLALCVYTGRITGMTSPRFGKIVLLARVYAQADVRDTIRKQNKHVCGAPADALH